jgi:DNA polymerase-3 subunit delta
MNEITHAALSGFLKKTPSDNCPAVWLIHGQEVLVESAGEAVSRHLLGKDAGATSCEVIDGFAQNIPDLLAELNTFALLAAGKVVMFKDARIFQAGGSKADSVSQVEAAWEDQNIAKAAKSLLSLCGRLEADIEQVPQQLDVYPDLQALSQSLGQKAIRQLVNYCMDQGWTATTAGSHVETLQKGIEKGFPNGHILLITANQKAPKNLKIYKTIAAKGAIVDCSVPLGERRADKDAQQAVLRQAMQDMLKNAGKRLAPSLFQELVELTGFDLRVFIHNLEKLISYVGAREEITSEDIRFLLRRTKSDPLFQLTNAIADRNVKQALFFTHSLLSDQWHPLQLLAALVNQIRRLLVAKDFAGSTFGQSWVAGMPYAQFQQIVMPAISAYDEHVGEQLIPWPVKTPSKKEKGRKDASTDLRLAPNPRNPFPVYQTMLKSGNYSQGELLSAMIRLNETDLRLKSSGQDPFLVMKKILLDICGINKPDKSTL